MSHVNETIVAYPINVDLVDDYFREWSHKYFDVFQESFSDTSTHFKFLEFVNKAVQEKLDSISQEER